MTDQDFRGEQVRLALDAVVAFVRRCFEPTAKRLLAKVIADAQAATAAHNAPEAVAARQAKATVAEAKRNASHVAEWRANLQKYAPIAEWEVAWSPKSGKDWESMRVVAEWLAGEFGKRHLFLFGGVGCGKSIAAAWAVKHWVEPGTFDVDPVSWLRPNQLVSAVCHAYDPASPRIRRYVVIDDLGMERHEDFEHAMCELLDRQGLTMLVTSNLTTAQFKSRFTDPRLISRLNGSAMSVHDHGPDRRPGGGGF